MASDSANQDNSPAISFSSDRPILTRAEDLLGRRQFAEHLADAIVAWRGTDSLVLALYGSWGAGKSSVKNMVLETLATHKSPPREVVEFNPWHWSAQEQIVAAFFAEIGKVLGRADPGKLARQRARAWRRYAILLRAATAHGTRLGDLVTGVAKFVPATVLLTLLLANAGLVSLSLVALVVFFLVGLIGLFADTMAELAENRVSSTTQTLPELKDDLAKALAKLEAPILVVIDDIDRLPRDQITSLLQLVKANADFPNIVYLLLAQRDVVVRALGDNDLDQGGQFLQKVVQVGFDLPLIDIAQVQTVLLTGLNELLGTGETPKRFDRRRWTNLYAGHLRKYFSTLRDVRRFLNAFSFTLGLFSKASQMEVDPVDLIGIEVLRVFEPVVYERVSRSKELLTARKTASEPALDRNTVARQIESLVPDGVLSDRRDELIELVQELFAPIRWAFGGSSYAYEYFEEWERELRVCSSRAFDRYFQLAIGGGDVSRSEILALLDESGDKAAILKQLRDFEESGRLAVLLERLDAYKKEVPRSAAGPFVSALADVAARQADVPSGLFDLGGTLQIQRLSYWALRGLPSSERVATVEQMLAHSDVYLPVELIASDGRRSERGKHPVDVLFAESGLVALRETAAATIAKWAYDGRLWDHPKLVFLLHAWGRWRNYEEPGRRLAEVLGEQKVLLHLIRAASGVVTSQTVGEYFQKQKRQVNLGNFVDLVDVDEVAQRVSALDRSSVSSEDAALLEAFDAALQKRAQGRDPDIDDFDD